LIGTMAAMEWTLELVLVVLLGATLFQAIKLERALGMLQRDRASLEALVVGFNASTHQAESGIQRLREAADGAGRQIEAQLSKSVSLKDDLAFLTERGDRLADRLDILVRAARPLAQDRADERPQTAKGAGSEAIIPKATSQVERDLLQALRMAR
jgi:chromosome segregation ATPase